VKKYFQQIGGDCHGEIVYETQSKIDEWVGDVIRDVYDGDVLKYARDNDAIGWSEIEVPEGRRPYTMRGVFIESLFAVDLADPYAAVLRWCDGEWTPTGATTSDLGILD